jgi:hypothetical protein
MTLDAVALPSETKGGAGELVDDGL